MASIIRWSPTSISVSNDYTVLSNLPFVADKTEHQIRSREARIEALEAALRARDRQLDALIA